MEEIIILLIIKTGFNSTRNNRSQRLRYKIRDYDNYNTNNEYNNNFNNEYNEINNEYNNEQKANLKDNNIINRNKYCGNEYLGATPKYKRRFHKTQIFNHYKPFMVDDFKEYADYE